MSKKTEPAFSRALTAAIRSMLSPEHMKVLVGALYVSAVQKGDVQAAKILLDRALGRVRGEPVTDELSDLPSGLKTTSDVVQASNALLKAVTSGRIAPEDAQKTSSIIEAARKSIETEDLEKRLAALEARSERS